MRQNSTQNLMKHWFDLTKDNQVSPLKSAFDPALFKDCLGQLMMVYHQPNGYEIRLSGAKINSLYGKNLKQSHFFEVFEEPFHRLLEASLKRSAHLHLPLVLECKATWCVKSSPQHLSHHNETPQQDELGFELYLCPFCTQKDRVDRFVVLLVFTKTPKLFKSGVLGPMTITKSCLVNKDYGRFPAGLWLIEKEAGSHTQSFTLFDKTMS